MSVEVVIPYRPRGPHAMFACDFVCRRWADQSWADVVGLWAPLVPLNLPPRTAPVAIRREAEPWIKALAVMPAVERSKADVIVMADADVWCDRVEDAVSAVQAGATWAVPHETVHRLTEAASEAYMAGESLDGLELTQPPYPGLRGGGLLVIRRDAFIDCPLDPRFEGWGQEDHSLGLALHALHGPPWQNTAPLVHLWHPEPERLDRKGGSEIGWLLFRRYCRARKDPDDLEGLLTEARDALRAYQSTMHSAPAVEVGRD